MAKLVMVVSVEALEVRRPAKSNIDQDLISFGKNFCFEAATISQLSVAMDGTTTIHLF